MTNQNAITLAELVARFGGELIGAGDGVITQVGTLTHAQPDQISFLANGKYKSYLAETKAGAVILSPSFRDAAPLPRIITTNPYAYFAKVAQFFNPRPISEEMIHPSAVVHDTAEIDASVQIDAHVVIGRHVRIEQGVIIRAGCVIDDNVVIKQESYLYPRVVIYKNCEVGARNILHAGVVIGSDGFGLALETDSKTWTKIPQIGRVILGDDVEIGANTTIDRGAIDDTIIEEGVKLDNQIQIAHNVRIGAHTAMAGCVGVAGSAKIGKHCTIGGGAIVLGHLEVTDHVDVSAGSLITKSITEAGRYTSALPFMTHRDWRNNIVHLRRMDTLVQHLRTLQEEMKVFQSVTMPTPTEQTDANNK